MWRVGDWLRPNNMKPLNLDFVVIVVLDAPYSGDYSPGRRVMEVGGLAGLLSSTR